MRRLALPALFAGLLAAAQPAAAQSPFIPEGYPDDYAEIVAAAEQEGQLIIYGTMAAAVWQPILEEFGRRYPAIRVETLDLGDELFERYLAEASAGARTADLITSAAAASWLDISHRDQVLQYDSPENAMVPDWARPLPGVYVMSADPFIMSYSKALIPADRYPDSIADVAQLVQDFPDLTLTTYDARGGIGYAVWSAWVRDNGEEGWEVLKALGPKLRLEASAGSMVNKLVAGEYAVTLFVGASVPIRILNAAGADQVGAYGLVTDGTPIMMRGVGITRGARSPNAARLLLDFILSRDGQLLLAKGNLTPYRADIGPGDVANFTFNGIVEAIGEENVNIVRYDQAIVDGYDAFVARWTAALRGE